MFINPPTEDILQLDFCGCEVACAVQLFHMAGIPLPGGSREVFEWQVIGREPGQVEKHARGQRALLENGFELVSCQPVSSLELLAPENFYRLLVFHSKLRPEIARQVVEDVHHLVVSHSRGLLALRHEFVTYQEIVVEPNEKLVKQFLRDGYVVLCPLEYPPDPNMTHAVLLFLNNKSEIMVFSPGFGEYPSYIRNVTREYRRRLILAEGITAYRI